jgi:Transglutaminase-like superfamily/TgpA N-terminal domain/Domain of unknown function (DUF4129)
MTSASSERSILAVALGAAGAAYAAAFVAPVPIATIAGGGLGMLVWFLYGRRRAGSPRPWLGAAVRILLLTTGLITLFSRNVPLLAEGVAMTGAFVTGGLLVGSALLLSWYGPAQPRHTGLVPVALGILVSAGLHPGARAWFVTLACISGTSLWAWALVAGGPRRNVVSLALFLVFGVALAGGAALFLPWAQPHVEEWVAGVYADGQTGLSGWSSLGDVRSLARSRRVVARVWTTKPQLLRMQVFTDFDGKSWAAKRAEARELEESSEANTDLGPLLRATPGALFFLRDARPGIETRVVPSLSWSDGWGLLLPAHPTLLRLPAERLKVDDSAGLIDTESASVSIYAVGNETSPSAPEEPAPEDPSRRVLDVGGIRRLAGTIGGEAGTAREKVARTVAYLQGPPFRYTLEDLPVSFDEFLRKKAGYCEYFATAAVLLLRQQGVPARYVKGVRVSAESRIGDHYLVRESDAHAWVEAYLPGEGWVEADPTPARDHALATDPPGVLAERWEGVESWLIETRIRLQEEALPALRAGLAALLDQARDAIVGHAAALAGSLMSAGLALLAWKRRPAHGFRPRRLWSREDEALVPGDLRDRIRRMERRWARLGHPRPPANGLREHLEDLPADLIAGEERAASARLVAAYYAVRYGGSPLTEEMLRGLEPPPSTRNDRGVRPPA